MFDRFVGIPWLDQGRSLVGLDCYGLVRLAFRELRGIDLPSYAERYVTAADGVAIARLIAGQLDPWDEVATGKELAFDAVLLREGRLASHIGLVVRPGLMLHVERGETSRIERYGSGALRHRVIGFYRYRESPEPGYRDHE
jgi:cell wall-associated NlpC family hydrolase